MLMIWGELKAEGTNRGPWLFTLTGWRNRGAGRCHAHLLQSSGRHKSIFKFS